MIPKKASLRAVVVLTAFSLGANGRESLTGTWKWGNPKNGGGILRVVDGDVRLDFQLELWRGAPSDNEGSLEGSLAVKDGKGTFRGGEAGGPCEIAFEFRGNEAVLKTTGTDAGCGFGYGVHADGIYVRKSRKKPVFD